MLRLWLLRVRFNARGEGVTCDVLLGTFGRVARAGVSVFGCGCIEMLLRVFDLLLATVEPRRTSSFFMFFIIASLISISC